MAADGATLCSMQGGPSKAKKWSIREVCKYLIAHRIDRTQIWRKKGGVLIMNEEALKQVMEKKADQRSLNQPVMGCCSCGATHPSRRRRGGNRNARRQRQHEKRESFRDGQTLSSVLAAALNPSQGGSAPRITERPVQLQKLQQFAVNRLEKGDKIRSDKDQMTFVGITTPTSSTEERNENAGKNAAGSSAAEKYKKGSVETGGDKNQNKAPRGMEDGLLLVVTARINGHTVRALIDSGATRCFVTPACITAVGLKGIPRDVFLELGNGQKYLSRGYVPEVPVVTGGLTVRVGLTVTNLLHDVDLVLGVNWLELVNPVVDWQHGKLYLPNAINTALLQGQWLEDHVQAGTVTVLAGQEALRQLAEAEVQRTIQVLRQPKFWQCQRSTPNSRTNFFKGDVQWGYLYGNNCKICNFENNCNRECKHMRPCKLFVIKGNEGEGILKVKRMNGNAKLPVRGTEGAAGYDLAAAEAAVVPAHGKCLVKTGLQIALPPRLLWKNCPTVRFSNKKIYRCGGRCH